MAAMAFNNATRRNNAHQTVDSISAGLPVGAPTVVEDRTGLSIHEPPAPTVYCEFRFVVLADRESFYSSLIAQLSGAAGPTVGSWIAKHDCYNDEGLPCIETERLVF